MRAFVILENYQDCLNFGAGRSLIICADKETAITMIGNSRQHIIEVEVAEVKP